MHCSRREILYSRLPWLMIMHHVQGAIVTMTKALAKDLIQKKGIRVNAGMLTAS